MSLKAFKELRRRRRLPVPRAAELETFASEQAGAFYQRLRQGQTPETIDGLE